MTNKNRLKKRKRLHRPRRRIPPARPHLRFSPTAWAKLLFLRDLGSTEVGGFGVSHRGDLLYVENIELVRQTCTTVTVHFDDAAVADFFDAQIDAGRRPEEFARIWIHTHPGDSPNPSSVDEETFQRVFGSSDWAVMFILARGGKSYARLRFNVGPAGALRIPVEVDFTPGFAASDQEAWEEEYHRNVISAESFPVDDFDWWDDPQHDAWFGERFADEPARLKPAAALATRTEASHAPEI